jgi:hypothetical protein
MTYRMSNKQYCVRFYVKVARHQALRMAVQT